MMQKNTISFYTLGCRSNQSETAVATNLFENQGYRIIDPGNPSNLVVINTCTVTKKADTDTRRLVNRILRINPESQIALIGCQAQVQKEQLSKLPNIKWIIGNEEKMNLVTILKETGAKDPQKIITPQISSKSFSMPIAGIDRYHTRANIKIQDGCNSFCSYCEVPYARGRARSRKFKDIIKEAKTLALGGHKELIITGINVGTYSYNKKNIVDIINALEDIAELKRIRISSIEPTTILNKLIKKMGERDTKLCRYLHIPIQSANNTVLKLMRRRYSAEKILQFIKKAAYSIKDICIGTDIIVGFPGEIAGYFEDTYKKLCAAPINYFHVFSYSQRQMAKSKDFPNKIDIPTIAERSRLLRTLSQKKRQSYYTSMLGRSCDVLFEQKKGTQWKGLTDNYIHVKVSSNKNLSNQILPVKLMKVVGQEVVGEFAVKNNNSRQI